MMFVFWLLGIAVSQAAYRMAGRRYGWDLKAELVAVLACLAVWAWFFVLVPIEFGPPIEISYTPLRSLTIQVPVA